MVTTFKLISCLNCCYDLLLGDMIDAYYIMGIEFEWMEETCVEDSKCFFFGLVNQELVLLATSIKRNNIIWKRRGFNGICVKCG